MTDFLLELRSEEIPARMQARAREDLARLFAAELARAGLAAGPVRTYATPRRLALIARDLPDATAAVSEELKGPRTSAPPAALDGFLRKTGLDREALTERDGVWYGSRETPGRATADVLADAVPAIVRAFPWPKSMRWGAASASSDSPRWVRPLSGIVAIFGDAVVDCAVAGLRSGRTSAGHRFHHPDPVTLTGAAGYVEAMRDAHVIVDPDERAAIIATGAQMLAGKAGLSLVRDEGLLAENAGLTEWPVPLLGRFDPDYLSVPPEVIQLTARVNQKYFVATDADGGLANAFVCVANIDADDGGARIVEGNRKVLAARLSDARFFYETDLRTSLEDLTPKLEKIVFHEKLGTVADKVDRVAKLARWLVEEGIISSPERRGGPPAKPVVEGRRPKPTPPASLADLATLAERAARLAKADLVTGMVGEFPELQGIMGGYYAAAQGEDPRVAAAIRDHYKPVGAGDAVPTDPVTVAVSLADKLDTLAAFFIAEMPPTGSKDPFALRRAALGIIQITQANGLRYRVSEAFLAVAAKIVGGGLGARARQHQADLAAAAGASGIALDMQQVEQELSRQALGTEAMERHWQTSVLPALRAILDFFADRLKVQQREAGVRHDLIDAVFALGGEDDLVRLLARVHALQGFVGTEDGANLLAGYKRAANILKKEGFDTPATADAISLSYTPEPAERGLIDALAAAEPRARAAVAAEAFAGAMAALATLRAPIDAFFDSVTVNDADPAKREARLALLARMRDAVHAVADFSRIEG